MTPNPRVGYLKPPSMLVNQGLLIEGASGTGGERVVFSPYSCVHWYVDV